MNNKVLREREEASLNADFLSRTYRQNKSSFQPGLSKAEEEKNSLHYFLWILRESNTRPYAGATSESNSEGKDCKAYALPTELSTLYRRGSALYIYLQQIFKHSLPVICDDDSIITDFGTEHDLEYQHCDSHAERAHRATI